jgi:putative DNA primase/helicase
VKKTIKPVRNNPGKNPGEPFSDDNIAWRFAVEHRNRLRFTSELNRWNIFDGMHWGPDRVLQAFDLARTACRTEAAKVDGKHKGLRRQLSSARMVMAVVKLAQAAAPLATTSEQWDRDPWLLATPGGTVDLHTGIMRPNNPADFITRITAVTPAPAGSRPPELWTNFLRGITSGDRNLEDFLGRMYGYSLTASVIEEALFFLYGAGFNGKTTYLNTVTGPMGTYYRPASIETFMAHAHPQHPCDVADLWGARLVTGAEPSEGQCFDEAKIKMLTGRDPQKGRFMRSNPTQQMPTQKFWITGNHQPRLRVVDKGIEGRLFIVPFLAHFSPDSPDRIKDLEEKLKPFWSYVLRWGIDQCLEWQRRGLDPPACVRDATKEYFEVQDVRGRWIEECCELKPAFTSNEDLHRSFIRWAERTGEKEAATWSSRKLSDELAKDERFHRDKQWNGYKQVRGFVGISLLDSQKS